MQDCIIEILRSSRDRCGEEETVEQRDVVIVGAGMGGLITGALLAKYAGRRVLVLEKEAEIGGRTMSYGGPHGSFTEKEYRRLLQGASGVHIVTSDPSIEEIIEKQGLFENYIIDSGWHGVSAGSRNRFSVLAKAMGKSLPTANQVGLLVRQDGEFVELSETVKTWPAESVRERSRVASERLRISMAETAAYDHVDIQTYLESVTTDQRVRDYYGVLGKFQMCVNDQRDASAGEWMRCNNMTSATGAHLTQGGGMGDVSGGFKNICIAFAEIISENGGEIVTDAKVTRVLIENYRATGVEVQYGRHDRTTETIRANTVISNLPMDTIHRIVPKEHFPREFCERIAHLQPITGILGHICTREPLETKWPKGLFLTDLPNAPKVRGGTPLFSYEQTSVIDPVRVINGDNVLTQSWLALWCRDPDEAHDRPLVDALVEAQLAFFREQYPNFDDVLEWYIFVIADRVYGVAPTPGYIGDRRPTVRHPVIPNLFFTGDTVTQTDVGTSGAAHGGILCANAVSGQNFLTLLPEFMR
jgi:phytoene dehydrogenase-like protein